MNWCCFGSSKQEPAKKVGSGRPEPGRKEQPISLEHVPQGTGATLGAKSNSWAGGSSWGGGSQRVQPTTLQSPANTSAQPRINHEGGASSSNILGANGQANPAEVGPDVERVSSGGDSIESPPSFKGFLTEPPNRGRASTARVVNESNPSSPAVRQQVAVPAAYGSASERERQKLPTVGHVPSPLHSAGSNLESEKAEITEIMQRKKVRDGKLSTRSDSDASSTGTGLGARSPDWKQPEPQRFRTQSVSSNGSLAYRAASLGGDAPGTRPGYHSRAQSEALSPSLSPSRHSSIASRSGLGSVRDSDSGARPAGLHTTRSGNLSGAPGETGQNGADLYEVVGNLGSGSSSTGVMRIMRDRRSKELVAAKWVQHTQGSALSVSLEREIVNHRRLLHPNIIRFREVFATDEYLIIVMDYASIGPLSERIASSGPLSEGIAKLLFRQLVDGMVYCHRQGVVHRNLVLANLLLDGHAANPVLKISGFGYSKAPDLDSAPKSAVTAPMFLSPEVLLGLQQGQRYDGRASDVWACGIILFNIVTGRLPFQDDADSGMQGAFKSTQRILNCEYNMPTNVILSAEVKDLIARIFVQDPKKRIDSYDLTKHPWLSGAVLPAAKPETVIISKQSESDISDVMARARKRREARLAAQKAKSMTPEHFNEDLIND